MPNLKRKLTDDEITKMEAWAKNKKAAAMTETEKNMVDSIESMEKNDWKGCRIEDNTCSKTMNKQELQEKLEKLKKKA